MKAARSYVIEFKASDTDENFTKQKIHLSNMISEIIKIHSIPAKSAVSKLKKYQVNLKRVRNADVQEYSLDQLFGVIFSLGYQAEVSHIPAALET